jgi:hypothetical protein
MGTTKQGVTQDLRELGKEMARSCGEIHHSVTAGRPAAVDAFYPRIEVRLHALEALHQCR